MEEEEEEEKKETSLFNDTAGKIYEALNVKREHKLSPPSVGDLRL